MNIDNLNKMISCSFLVDVNTFEGEYVTHYYESCKEKELECGKVFVTTKYVTERDLQRILNKEVDIIFVPNFDGDTGDIVSVSDDFIIRERE